jgi:hypothetical protein
VISTATAPAGNVLYSDALVELTDQHIRLKCYSLLGGDKTVSWEDVEFITALTPTIRTGRWQLWGSGWFKYWFARDFDRPIRPTIFSMKLRTQWVRPVFTAHDARRAKEIFQARGVLDDRQGEIGPMVPTPPAQPIRRSAGLYALLAVFALMIGDLIYHYPLLPQHVATHFGASGQADGWSSKQMLAVMTVVSGAMITGIFLLIGMAASQTAAAVFGKHMLWLGVGVLLLIASLAHLGMRANLNGSQSMGMAPWYLMGGFGVWIIGWLIVMFHKLSRA